MLDNRTSAQINGTSKQKILQAAQNEMERYEDQIRQQARTGQKTFDVSTAIIVLLALVLTVALIFTFVTRKPATPPSPDNQSQQAN